MPKSITAVESTETRKAFIAASEPRRSRFSATIAKVGSDTTSSAITTVARSRALAQHGRADQSAQQEEVVLPDRDVCRQQPVHREADDAQTADQEHRPQADRQRF